MNNQSPKHFLSWVAAIAFILTYLLILHPMLSRLGSPRMRIADVIPVIEAVSERQVASPGHLSIHTWAGTLVLGDGAKKVAAELEGVRAFFRVGPIVFMPGEPHGF